MSRSNDSIATLKTATISQEELVPHDTEDPVDLFAQLDVDVLALEESFVDGGKGDDHLYGGSGNDVLVGGPGHDVFDCGEGIDQVLDFNPKEDTLSTNCEVDYRNMGQVFCISNNNNTMILLLTVVSDQWHYSKTIHMLEYGSS